MQFGTLTVAYENDTKICDKHKIPFIKSPRLIEPVCPKCEGEAIEEQNQKKVNEISKEIDNKERLYFLEELSMYDETLVNASFENFETPTEIENEKLVWAKKMATSWLKGERHNILLQGNAGTGKSHLAFSIVKALSERTGKKGLFVNVPTLINKVAEDNFARKGYYIDQLTKVDYLVLDDLGKEIKSNLAKDVIYQILNGRSNTIITTNLTEGEMTARFYGDQALITRIRKGIPKGSKNEMNFNNLENKRGFYF